MWNGLSNCGALSLSSEVVERVSSSKFLGVTAAGDPVKSIPILEPLIVNFYNRAIINVLTSEFLVWFTSCTQVDQLAIQRVVETAGKITGNTLPGIDTIHAPWCWKQKQFVPSAGFKINDCHFEKEPEQ